MSPTAPQPVPVLELPVADPIRCARLLYTRLNWTQKEIGALLGVSHATVSRWVRGHVKRHIPQMRRR